MNDRPANAEDPAVSHASTRNIAILGAGVSGLSLAWYLRQQMPEWSISVYDAGSRPGGVIQTHYEEPLLVETGADNFATLIPTAMELVQAQGLESEFIHPNQEFRLAQVVHKGNLVPIPNGFSLMQPTQLFSMIATPLLSWKAKLRILAEYTVKARKSDEDESVESFAVRRLGRECFDRLVEPIVGGIFTARAETLSMQAAMPQFVRMERQYGSLIRAAMAKRKSMEASETSARLATGARYDQFVAPKQGMSWWMDQLAKGLGDSLHQNTTIDRLERTDDGRWRLIATQSSDSELGTKIFDTVCMAVPSYRAAKLLKSLNKRVSTLLDRIPYASSAIAVLALKKSEIRPSAFCFGLIVPKVENRDCLAISLTSEKYPGRCPPDTVLARVFMGGAIRPELLERSDDALLGIARKEVEQLLGVKSLPHWQRLVRWNEAMPQYVIGHKNLVSSIQKEMEAFPTLHLLGNAYDGVGIPQCIRLAQRTAATVIASLRVPRPISE